MEDRDTTRCVPNVLLTPRITLRRPSPVLHKDRPSSLRNRTRMPRLPTRSQASDVLARNSGGVSFFLGSQQRVEEEAEVEPDVPQLAIEVHQRASEEQEVIELTIAP